MVLIGSFAAQRGRVLLWAPVALSCGIGAYFAMKHEPGELLLRFVALIALLAVCGGWVAPRSRPPLILVAAGLAGVILAAEHTHRIAAPVIEHRMYTEVEGRLVGLDRSLSDRHRLTLDQIKLADLPAERTPRKVRIALHGDVDTDGMIIGARIRLRANLSPPSGPVEPNGFDFQRHAWFQQLGAVGYTRDTVLVLSSGQDDLPIARIRQDISRFLRESLDGNTGAFAAAILAGDRSGIAARRDLGVHRARAERSEPGAFSSREDDP